jgi:hypothetical protein
METHSPSVSLVARNGWIFSPRYDFLFFYLPFLLGWAVLITDANFNLNNVQLLNRSGFVMLFALSTFLDTGHILSTIWQVYGFREERLKYKRMLILAPLFFLGINLLIYWALGMKYVLYFFGYFNYYHIIKQQYGWMAYSTRRSGFFHKADFLFDKIYVYAVMIIPFVWAHFSEGGTENRSAVLFFGKNLVVADTFKYLFVAIVAAYLCKLVYMMAVYRFINISKTLLLLTTAIAWGALIFIRSPYCIFITAIMHAIPYMALIYFYGERRSRVLQKKNWFFSRSFSFLLFPAAILLAGFFYTHLLRYVGNVGRQSNSRLPFEIISILFSVAFFMHYYLDGVIWKRRNFKPEEM